VVKIAESEDAEFDPDAIPLGDIKGILKKQFKLLASFRNLQSASTLLGIKLIYA